MMHSRQSDSHVEGIFMGSPYGAMSSLNLHDAMTSEWQSCRGHLHGKSSWCNVVRVTVLCRASSWGIPMVQCCQRDCHVEGIFMGSLHDAMSSERQSCAGHLHGKSSRCNVLNVTVFCRASSWDALTAQFSQSDCHAEGIFMGSPHGAMSSEWQSCAGHLYG